MIYFRLTNIPKINIPMINYQAFPELASESNLIISIFAQQGKSESSLLNLSSF